MNPGLRIAFFGSSLLSSYWNGAATYYRGLIRELDRLGHRVTFYEPDAYGRQQKRDIEPPPWAAVHVYAGDDPLAVEQALESASKASDWIFKASGVGVFDEWLENEVPKTRTQNLSVGFWDVDAPATLERLQANSRDPFLQVLPRFDLVLTYGGGYAVQQAYLKAGARSCQPIYNALDPETHFPVPFNPAYAATLGLLANRLPDRESRIDEFFFTAADLLPREPCLLGGAGWDSRSLPANVRWAGHVSTADHNAFNCSARCVLNVSRESMARWGFSPATRVFEAAGAGACLITDAWEGIEFFLEPGVEVLVAASGAAVAEHVRKIDEQSAGAIGQAALRRVLAKHTYRQRAAEVDAILTGRALTVSR